MSADYEEEGMEMERGAADWFLQRKYFAGRFVFSLIASFFFGGLAVARLLVLVAEHHGSVHGAIATTVVLVTIWMVVVALIWVVD